MNGLPKVSFYVVKCQFSFFLHSQNVVDGNIVLLCLHREFAACARHGSPWELSTIQTGLSRRMRRVRQTSSGLLWQVQIAVAASEVVVDW